MEFPVSVNINKKERSHNLEEKFQFMRNSRMNPDDL